MPITSESDFEAARSFSGFIIERAPSEIASIAIVEEKIISVPLQSFANFVAEFAIAVTKSAKVSAKEPMTDFTSFIRSRKVFRNCSNGPF